jgi:hypothetical protein
VLLESVLIGKRRSTSMSGLSSLFTSVMQMEPYQA